MTRLLQSTEFLPGSKLERVERSVTAARAILAWERLWPALWPASGIIGLGLAAALFDLLTPLPWALHALILASLVTATALALYFNLRKFTWPSWEAAARRLERDSSLEHRPISEAHDTLAAGRGDVYAEELWRAHLRRRLTQIGRLRLARPRSALLLRDPRGLRFAVLALIVLGALAAGSDWSRRLTAAWGPAAGKSATLDAWIDPPPYTGEAPIYLASSGPHALAAPQGSVLHLRVHGADHTPSASLAGVIFSGGDGEYTTSAVLAADAHLRVRADGRTIGNWKIAAIPDRKPVMVFAAPPAATERSALKLSYRASDDYGVVGARALLRPHGHGGKTIVIDLPLPERSARTASETTFRDLTEHPYAGMEVDITLEAVDAAGQTGISNPVRFKLPARVFSDPLARALIEQRQALGLGGRARERVLRTLDALALAPDQFYAGRLATYLALRAAYWGLKYASRRQDIERIQDLLWQTAVGLEGGGSLTAAEELRRLRLTLTQMLARGAPQNEIDALLTRYRILLQRYLQALAASAPASTVPPDQNAKILSAQDLNALLKAIAQLSQSGDRLKAAQLLAFLQDLIENLRIVPADNQALRKLGELIGNQRMLLDKTFRQSQGLGDPRDGGAKGLARSQGRLRDDLGAILKRQNPNADLERAGKMMGESEEAIALGDFPRAGTLQKYILGALRRGANTLARKWLGGRAPGGAGLDPFGRNAGNRGGWGGELRIPDASVMQRARDILQELRRRAGEPARPQDELDYIERLLKRF